MFYSLKIGKIGPRFFYVLILCTILLLAFLFLRREKTVETVHTVPENATLEQFTLIIDAGHGGEDGGATGSGLLESAINLRIAQKLEMISGLWGIPTVMTRDSEDIPYPETEKTTKARKRYDQKARVELINQTPNGILISIHQNKYPSAKPRGAQVLYAKTEGSQALGELTHENLITSLDPENRRVAAPISDTIYLTKSVNCPAILVECGFLSHKEEAALLDTEAYQRKLATVLMASYLQYEALQLHGNLEFGLIDNNDA